MFHSHKDFAVYRPAEAARILGIAPGKVHRWLGGYRYSRGGQEIEQPALWTPEYPDEEDGLYLGFRDLIEIRFVDAFSRAGLNKNAIRALLSKAREWIGQDYPLSTTKFKTDGRTLFLEVWEGGDDGEVRTIDLRDGQHAFRSVVLPSFKDLEFEGGLVSKWYVAGKDQSIAIDPNIAFGQPVIESTGIPTARIYEAFFAEGEERAVARQFEVSLAAVRNAIAFEKRIAAKQ